MVWVGVTQNQAGRAALIDWLSYSLAELERAALAPETLESLLFQSLCPPTHDRHMAPSC